MGGIYALARLGTDSEQDYWATIEVLTAFVRLNAEWPQSGEEHHESDWEEDGLWLDIDIQAALTALANRPHRFGEGDWERHPLNLSKTDLRAGDLNGAHLYQLRLDR